ncbi:MAG: hypothetical protein OCD02_11425 [Spirochaetaceae bacterium]
MNKPLKKDNLIYKDVTEASDTIHNLLLHVNKKGLDWVPKSYGVDGNGKHVLSYIDGYVPNGNPSWLWEKDLLIEVTDSKNTVSDDIYITFTSDLPNVSFSKTFDITSYTGTSISNVTTTCVYASGQNIYVGTSSNGLLYSNDGGTNWTTLLRMTV